MKPDCTYHMLVLLLGLSLQGAAIHAADKSASDYYTEPQIYNDRPIPTYEYKLPRPIGVCGIMARVDKGVVITVEETEPGTPAHGKFKKNDIILGVNGVMLKGKHPWVVLGTALNQAEAKDGVLTFDITPACGGTNTQVSITIPVMGAYSATFPLNCEKSKKIIKHAAEFYSGKDRLKTHNMHSPLACLFLLSTGDDQYLPRVKEYFAQFLKDPSKFGATGVDDPVQGVGRNNWYNGYNGVAVAEYYLRTGDTSVLPLLQYYCDDARKQQAYGLGWGHWANEEGVNPVYEAGGGMIHCAGNQLLLTLVLGKACGVTVDEKTLLGALKHWYSYAGHGSVPVADNRPWYILRNAGKDGASAAVMHIASGAKGDVTIYKQAKEYFALSALTSWPARDYNWEVIWEHLASPFMLEYNPDLYYQTQQRFTWQYDLNRHASGAFSAHVDHYTFDAVDSGISLALGYTAPLKTLQITGAPRSKHAKDFTLPTHLWGNTEDRAFLSSKHNPDFYKYGKEEEIYIPFRQLPIRLQYGPGDVKGLPLTTMLKNVRHARYEIRTGAAKALCMNKQYRELEKLLSDPDPRLRRAALDGINDYRAWFLATPAGQHALKTEEYTPAMTKAITAILSDPKEAWYVTDAALLALHNAPVKAIVANMPAILRSTTHEDWWLRESAFFALLGLQKDEKLFVEHLPVMIDMTVKEYRFSPAQQMRTGLMTALRKKGAFDQARAMIIGGFVRVVKETTILPDKPRVSEGSYNAAAAAQECLQQAPESALEVAEAITSRLPFIQTRKLIDLVASPGAFVNDQSLGPWRTDVYAHYPYGGFFTELDKLDAHKKKQMIGILYNDVRPELITRVNAGNNDMRLLDTIVDIVNLKKSIRGWQGVGTPAPAKRVWRFVSFDPQTDKDKVHPREHKRFRDSATLTLPAGLEGWYKPGYDDNAWKSGTAPIGTGEYKHPQGRYSITNNSDWGEGEFLFARTTFTVTDDDLTHDYYRIAVLAANGYEIYLNGTKIHGFGWWQDTPFYCPIPLEAHARGYLKKGVNTLAVYANAEYPSQIWPGQNIPKRAQIDCAIESLKKVDFQK